MSMEIQGVAQAATQFNVRVNSEQKSASKEQENSAASSSSGTTQAAKTSGAPASSGTGEASTGSSGTCSNCGATLSAGASVCGKCGTEVESETDKLLKMLSESGLKANSTDNGISSLSVQAMLASQEEETK